MTLIEGIQLALSSGVLSGGVGVLVWAVKLQGRVADLEAWRKYKFPADVAARA